MTEDIIKENGKGKRVYEVSYLLLPTLTSDIALSKSSSLKESISTSGAEIISGEDPILIDLAYVMVKEVNGARQKFTSGYFGWIKFEFSIDDDNTKVNEIKKIFSNNPEIIRFLIIKTVRENTLLQGKMTLQKEDKPKKEYDAPETNLGEVVVEESKVSTEEMDKSIDDLVIA